MMAFEERLAHVEGLVLGHAQLLGDLRGAVNSLEMRVDRRFDQVETRLTALEQRVERKVDALEQKIDQKVDSTFRWTMGVMVTLFAAVIAAVLAR